MSHLFRIGLDGEISKPTNTTQQAPDDKFGACLFMENIMSSTIPAPQLTVSPITCNKTAFENLLAQAWKLRDQQKRETLEVGFRFW
jgi:hypothetical protein